MRKTNKKERILKNEDVYKRYHIPGMPNYAKRPKNAIYISPANSLKHELKKLEVCYELRSLGKKFVTEAVRNEKTPDGKERRVDVVDLETGDEIELETDINRAKRFLTEPNVVVIPVDWTEKELEKWRELKNGKTI